MKKLIFISTGRCGTKRIYEILDKVVPDDVAVVHQMKLSRLANILGTISIISKGKVESPNFYHSLIKPHTKNKSAFISTDPLSAMILPNETILSKNTCIVHISRQSDSFAHSFFKLSRSRPGSFIAHNFVPFWQPGLYPLENIFNSDIIEKYKYINELKNKYFREKYKINPKYIEISYPDIFNSNFLENIMKSFLGIDILLTDSDLQMRSNES